jgi:hypothetical protein
LAALDPQRAEVELSAVRSVFARKRTMMLSALTDLGIRFLSGNDATFYLWGNVAGLPANLNDGERLFRAALDEKVMLVPGAYFDVNPGKARKAPSRLKPWVRFSFGPPEDNLASGLARLTSLVERHRSVRP